jgi:hypothetical protein
VDAAFLGVAKEVRERYAVLPALQQQACRCPQDQRLAYRKHAVKNLIWQKAGKRISSAMDSPSVGMRRIHD